MTDLRQIDHRFVEVGRRCPMCNAPDLQRITAPDFIAKNGDGWVCAHCMIDRRGSGIWTDLAVKLHNTLWINKLRETGYPEDADVIERSYK